MKRKEISAITIGMLLAGAASATTFSHGEVTATIGFITPQILKTVSGAVSDQHFFNVAADASGILYVTNYISTGFVEFDSNGFPLPTVNIADLAISLFSDGGAIGAVDAGDSYIDYLGSNPGSPSFLNTQTFSSVMALPTGNYYFAVSGNANGIGTPPYPNVIYGIYDLNLAVTSVPEPETYAMLLAGLGLVGWAARRKG